MKRIRFYIRGHNYLAVVPEFRFRLDVTRGMDQKNLTIVLDWLFLVFGFVVDLTRYRKAYNRQQKRAMLRGKRL